VYIPRTAKLFRGMKNSYRIEKIRKYNYNKFNSSTSHWKIYGNVDISQIHAAIEQLIHSERHDRRTT